MPAPTLPLRRGSSEGKVPLHMLSAMRAERNHLSSRLAAAHAELAATQAELAELRPCLMQAEARCAEAGARMAVSAPQPERSSGSLAHGPVAGTGGLAQTDSVGPVASASNCPSVPDASADEEVDDNGWTFGNWVQSLRVDHVIANVLKTDMGGDATCEAQQRCANGTPGRSQPQ